MRLIEDNSDEVEELRAPDEPPALEPPEASRASTTITSAETQRSSPPLIRWIIAAVIVVILAFLILLLARWIYHKAHHAQPVTGTSQQVGQNSDLKTQPNQTPQPSGASSNGSNGSKNTGNATLPNNGPGNVAGVFAISSVTAAGLHYVIRSRRYS